MGLVLITPDTIVDAHILQIDKLRRRSEQEVVILTDAFCFTYNYRELTYICAKLHQHEYLLSQNDYEIYSSFQVHYAYGSSFSVFFCSSSAYINLPVFTEIASLLPEQSSDCTSASGEHW